MALTGASGETVRRALDDRDPLPGTGGFAGALDGRLVRDVLGRYPLFTERADPTAWSHDPGALADPDPVPAGAVRDETGTEQVWSLPERAPTDDEQRAVERLRERLDQTVAAVDTTGLAVAFSGGVDSALLAARLDAPLYTAGFPESHDLEAARTAADLLGADLHTVELDRDWLDGAVPRVALATGRTNAMDVGITLPLFAVAARASADGYERLALGQGADELFGGYAKVAQAPEDPRVDAETVRGARREMLGTLPAQLERDVLALRAAGVEPVTPVLHDRVVRAGLDLPSSLLVTDRGDRKWGFRLAVRPWLPDQVVFREKKAVQYGSLTARELDGLAREAGFKRRLDDHVSRYIADRLGRPAE